MTEATCGTVAGYSAHRRKGEPACIECKRARRSYYRERRANGPTCSVEGCHKPVLARGLCSAHYGKQQRNGSPLIDARDPYRNFDTRVARGPVPDYAPTLGSCLIWTGKTTTAGYGTFTSAQKYVHRYAWERVNGPIPEGLTIDHLCRVRNCVNPDHLEVVTREENSRREMAARKELAHV